jgi:hypothetical protein
MWNSILTFCKADSRSERRFFPDGSAETIVAKKTASNDPMSLLGMETVYCRARAATIVSLGRAACFARQY